MKYVSTRGHSAGQSFTEILLEGLASDGGLAVPEQWPRITRPKLDAMRDLAYPQLAFEILRFFADDFPGAALKATCEKAYTKEVFGTPEITPVKTLEDNFHLLACSNGPTLAFKDIAMQLIGHLFEHVLEKQDRRLNVLGATSGDTGSAAEHALKGKSRVSVFMLSPRGRMSPFQRAQMYALQDANIFNIAVEGVFDDCQDVVKAVNADAAFKERHAIGAVNSINWARIVAQVVYYFKGYFSVTRSNDEKVSFAVPSGNFGNIFACHVARRMGLPVARLVLATNENDVLDEFFRTGRYRPRRTAETHATSSPSMDISKASNFERFVWDMVDQDGEKVAWLWKQLEEKGGFDLSGGPRVGEDRGGLGLRLGPQPARRPHRHDPPGEEGLWQGDRPAHRRRREDRDAPSRPRHPHGVRRDGPARQVRGDHRRGARRAGAAPARLRGHREPAAALRRHEARRRGPQGVHRAARPALGLARLRRTRARRPGR